MDPGLLNFQLESAKQRRKFRKRSPMIEWAYFPRNQHVTPLGNKIVQAFETVAAKIDSMGNNDKIGKDYKDSASNVVLSHLKKSLTALGFKVELGKKSNQKISVPVLFGRNGKAERTFDADAYHKTEHFVVEVEAGRAITNNQFLKDLFQASVMVDVDYLAIAVRRIYRDSADYEKAYTFLETLYSSDRLKLPLKGVLLIGY
jgi:uridine kinase